MNKTLLGIALALGLGQGANAAEFELDISLETGPNHIRNQMVMDIVEKIEIATDGRLEFNVFHGSAKYKGKDEPTALAQGALDMGIVGTWYMGAVEPSFNMMGLPMFYGLPREEQYKVWDGATGQALNSKLEQKLNVVILGRSIDLGFGSMFFVDKPVQNTSELEGLKMRAPGGAINVARFEVQGATAVSIPFADVPTALQRGTVDGIASTHESVRSAKLWESGLMHSFSDYHAFYQYIPIISRRTWDELPEDIQTIVRDTWNANVDAARNRAVARQEDAAAESAKNGMTHVIGTTKDLAAMREKLMANQDALVEELRIDPSLVELAKSDLGM